MFILEQAELILDFYAVFNHHPQCRQDFNYFFILMNEMYFHGRTHAEFPRGKI